MAEMKKIRIQVLPLEEQHAGQAQAGRQGPGLYAAESDCRARGRTEFHSRHGQDHPALGSHHRKLVRRKPSYSGHWAVLPDNASRQGSTQPALLARKSWQRILSNLRAPKKANTRTQACRPRYGIRHGQDFHTRPQGPAFALQLPHDARFLKAARCRYRTAACPSAAPPTSSVPSTRL